MNMPVPEDRSVEVQSVRQSLEQKIAEGRLDLPVLPEVANQVLAVARDERADAARLARLIHQDQALAGHLVHIANSPAYLPRSPIVSLQQAVARLGLQTIARIALAVVVKGQLFDVRGHEQTIDYLWRHAAASAAWAQEIARMLRHNVETAFLCGLLHEIGKPACLHAITELEAEQGIRLEPGVVLGLMEDYQRQVGILLAEAWDLPGPVVESIRHYEDYAPAASFLRDAMIVHCAHRFASYVLAPEADRDEAGLRGMETLVELNLYPDDVTALLEQCDKVVAVMEAMTV